MTEANLQAFAFKNGIDDVVKSMSIAEKTQLRYNFIMDKMSNVQGDAKKTVGSYANQLKVLDANITNLSTNLGKKLLPVVNGILTAVNKLDLSKLMNSDFVKEIGKASVGMISLVGGMVAMGVAVNMATNPLARYGTIATGVIGILKTDFLGLRTVIVGTFNMFIQAINGIFKAINHFAVLIDKVIIKSEKTVSKFALAFVNLPYALDSIEFSIADKKSKKSINDLAKGILDLTNQSKAMDKAFVKNSMSMKKFKNITKDMTKGTIWNISADFGDYKKEYKALLKDLEKSGDISNKRISQVGVDKVIALTTKIRKLMIVDFKKGQKNPPINMLEGMGGSITSDILYLLKPIDKVLDKKLAEISEGLKSIFNKENFKELLTMPQEGLKVIGSGVTNKIISEMGKIGDAYKEFLKTMGKTPQRQFAQTPNDITSFMNRKPQYESRAGASKSGIPNDILAINKQQGLKRLAVLRGIIRNRVEEVEVITKSQVELVKFTEAQEKYGTSLRNSEGKVVAFTATTRDAFNAISDLGTMLGNDFVSAIGSVGTSLLDMKHQASLMDKGGSILGMAVPAVGVFTTAVGIFKTVASLFTNSTERQVKASETFEQAVIKYGGNISDISLLPATLESNRKELGSLLAKKAEMVALRDGGEFDDKDSQDSINKKIEGYSNRISNLSDVMDKNIVTILETTNSTLDGLFSDFGTALLSSDYGATLQQVTNDRLKKGMTQAFLSQDIMKMGMGNISSAIKDAIMNNATDLVEIDDKEMKRIREMYGAVESLMLPFADVLARIDTGVLESADKLVEASENLSNTFSEIPEGLKVLQKRFSSMTGIGFSSGVSSRENAGFGANIAGTSSNDKVTNVGTVPVVNIYGDVYGIEDFEKKVGVISRKSASNQNRLMNGTGVY